MRRALEAECAPRVLIPRIGNVQVEEVDLPGKLLLEPVHDGRHCLAAHSIRVEELDELGTAGLRELRDVARVVPDAVRFLGAAIGPERRTARAKDDEESGGNRYGP